MPKIRIDAQEIVVKEETTILQAARELGIEIPTLCYHAALGPYGACRLCMVEVKFPGRSKLVTSCTYPVWEGIEVITNSQEVIKARKFIIELLLTRTPNVKEIKELAEKLGVRSTRLRSENPDEKCILCGMCVRACKDAIGTSAISFVGRGIERKVTSPFEIESSDCIGCATCAFVCPTGAIKIEDAEKKRKIDRCHLELELLKCRMCDKNFVPLRDLDYIKKKVDLPKEIFELCPVCRRKELKNKIGSITCQK